MKTKHIIVLVALFLFSIILFIFRYNPIKYMGCVSTGGKYESLDVPAGAPSLGFKCVRTFTDGGKSCTSNNDCEGNCLIPEGASIRTKGDLYGVVGKCEDNDKRWPCYWGDFENPQGWCI